MCRRVSMIYTPIIQDVPVRLNDVYLYMHGTKACLLTFWSHWQQVSIYHKSIVCPVPVDPHPCWWVHTWYKCFSPLLHSLYSGHPPKQRTIVQNLSVSIKVYTWPCMVWAGMHAVALPVWCEQTRRGPYLGGGRWMTLIVLRQLGAQDQMTLASSRFQPFQWRSFAIMLPAEAQQEGQ